MSRQLTKKDGKTIKNWIGDNLQLAIIIVLVIGICLTLLSSLLVAKYTKQTSATDSARVAQFAISQPTKQTNTDLGINLTDASTTYTFTVSNVRDTSVVNEVKTSYDIVVTFPEALEDYVTLTMSNDNGATDKVAVVSADNKTFTFKEMGTFEANTARTDTISLKFTFDASTTDNINKTWSGIGITLKAKQVD